MRPNAASHPPLRRKRQGEIPIHILIVAHGSPPSADLLETLRGKADLVVATDGAADFLQSIGCAPHVVLGDFDSISPAALEAMDPARVQPAPDQDASDLEKAIAWALARGARTITITGATGGRLDHALTNMSILVKYAHEAMTIVEDWGSARAVKGEAAIEGAPGDILSLIAFAPARGVTLTGVRWPLHNDALAPGSRGVSNQFTEPVAGISVEEGVLIAVHLPKPDGRAAP